MIKQSLALVGLLTIPLMSHAVVVSVGSTQYDLNIITGTFSDNQAQLESQDWWGNLALAGNVASAGASFFGTQTFMTGSTSYTASPVAGHKVKAAGVIATQTWFTELDGSAFGPFTGARDVAVGESATWYVGTVVPVPAAAWLFGSALIGLAGIKRKK